MTMQNQNYQYTIVNKKTGTMLEVVSSPCEAVKTAFKLRGVEAELLHSKAPGNAMVTALKIKDKKPVAVACSWRANVDDAIEQMTVDAITYINHIGLIEPLLIEYTAVITDVAKSDRTGRSYVWFKQGAADYAATVYIKDKRVSIIWAADLTTPGRHDWLEISPSISQWIIEMILMQAGVVEVVNLKRDPTNYSWTWSNL